MRNILILLIASAALVFGAKNLFSANAAKEAEMLQKHVEQMKREKPAKYQAMVDRAGGSIRDCLSCHGDIFKNNRSDR